jgi:hypothetical protein
MTLVTATMCRMRIGWRSSARDEVTEIDADGNPVPSSLSPAEDLALRTRALGLCARCGGPLTEIWRAGCGTSTTTFCAGTLETVGWGAGGGGGGSWPPSDPGESWVFCSKEHMDAFLAERDW